MALGCSIPSKVRALLKGQRVSKFLWNLIVEVSNLTLLMLSTLYPISSTDAGAVNSFLGEAVS